MALKGGAPAALAVAAEEADPQTLQQSAHRDTSVCQAAWYLESVLRKTARTQSAFGLFWLHRRPPCAAAARAATGWRQRQHVAHPA